MITQFETLNYNSFPFPVESKLEIDFDPKYDQADRAVVGVTHSLRVTVTLKTDTLAGTTLSDGTVLQGTNETDLPAIKAALTKPGQALVLTKTGFGDLSVNGGSAKQDSAWGPKPRRCSFLPLGTNACVLRWSCDVQLPTCLNATFTGQVMAYNYSVNVSIDEQGYCTRTISGYFEIPLTRGADGGNTVSDSALSHWNTSTEPPVPENFRRISNDATESEDRRHLNFRVVDTETNDIILPPNVVDCRASHSVATLDKALKRMTATLRASYTLRKGVPKQDAFTYFLLLLWNKWNSQVGDDGALDGGHADPTSIVPMSLTLEDPDIYGRQAGNFSMTWTYVNGDKKASTTELDIIESAKNLVPNSALWNPGVKRGGVVIQSPNQNTWRLWAQSMTAVFGDNHPKFSYKKDDDLILDLCGDGRVPKVEGQYFRLAGYGSQATLDKKVRPNTYLKYDTALLVDTTRGAFARPGEFIRGAGKVIGDVVSSFWGAPVGNFLTGDIQNFGASYVRCTLFFDIIMVGTPPTYPVLTSVDNVKAVLHRNGRRINYLHAVLFGIPCFCIKGYDHYLLYTVPGSLPKFPPNYVLNNGEIADNKAGGRGFPL